jgi:phospholipid/cholesterol/gamma-HCH transport system substrate-binding protein
MPNRGPRVNPALVGLIGAATMFGLLFFAFTNVTLFASTMDVKAQVATGDTLAPGADVEIAGVKIGTVKSIDKGDPGARIDMTIDTKKASIYKDASIRIRPHGVFGPKFVELDPGNPSADAFADGDSVPLTRTHISVDFEEVLNTLDTNTRVSLQTFFVEFGSASDKRGADFGQFLDSLNTLETQLTPVLQVVDNRSSNLGRLFESNAVVSETYANSPFDQILAKNADAFAKLEAASPSLTGVIDHGNNVLASLDAITAGGNTQALAATVAKLPGLFDNLQRFNNNLGYGVNALAPEVTPQRGQVDSDVGLALKRSVDTFGECDITDQVNPGLVYGTLATTLNAGTLNPYTSMALTGGVPVNLADGTSLALAGQVVVTSTPGTFTAAGATVINIQPFFPTPALLAGTTITNPSDPRGVADTRHTNFAKIVPCYGPDGRPTTDAAGHVAHHHADVLLGLHNHPMDPEVGNLIPPAIVRTLNYPQSFQDVLLGDNEGAVLCGPNSDNSTRAPNPAFTCLRTPQSNPIPGHGTAPPALFGTLPAHAAAAPQPSATASTAALSRAVGHAMSSRQLTGHSRHLDLLVGLALLVTSTAVGYGFWRTRRV